MKALEFHLYHKWARIIVAVVSASRRAKYDKLDTESEKKSLKHVWLMKRSSVRLHIIFMLTTWKDNVET